MEYTGVCALEIAGFPATLPWIRIQGLRLIVCVTLGNPLTFWTSVFSSVKWS